MKRITTFAALAALALGAAACGKRGADDNANLSDADNMLIPADEGTANDMAVDNGAMTTGNEAAGNEAGVANAQ